jgi:hypothetical protein
MPLIRPTGKDLPGGGDYTPYAFIQLPTGHLTAFVERYINCVYS